MLLARAPVVEATGLSTVDWVAATAGDGVKVADGQLALQAVVDDFPQSQAARMNVLDAITGR